MAAVLKEEDFVEQRIARLESDVAHMRTDISELKSDFRETRKEIGDIRVDLVRLDGKVEALDVKIDKKAAENRVWTLMTFAGVLVSVANVVFHWVKG